MNNTGLLFVILTAVLVGALIPVLYHLVQVLKSAKQFLDQTGQRLDEALREITVTASHFNRVATLVETEASRLQPALDAAAKVGETITRARLAVNTASAALGALAPAFFAGIKTFFESRGGDAEADGDGPQADSGGREAGRDGV
jgi:ABC-type transporter Mla subunit MlaD